MSPSSATGRPGETFRDQKSTGCAGESGGYEGSAVRGVPAILGRWLKSPEIVVVVGFSGVRERHGGGSKPVHKQRSQEKQVQVSGHISKSSHAPIWLSRL